MSIPNLPVNFKDDILAASNHKRKYQQTFNSDGSVSLDDVTTYTQQGSEFGASQVNQTNGAINNIYDERVLTLEEAALVTETGFFVDAQVIAELSSKLAVVKFTIANTSYVNMPAQNCYYEPLTGKVHIEAVFLNSGGNIPGRTALATVPSLYRPLANYGFPAMFNNSCGEAEIDTNGVLRQYASNTQQYMYISTDYFI